MHTHIKLGRVFGIEIGIHSSWFIIAFLITFSLAAQFRSVDRDWSEVLVWGASLATAILFFVSLLAHELAHSLVAQARKLPVRRITLFALGGVSLIEKEAPDATTEWPARSSRRVMLSPMRPSPMKPSSMAVLTDGRRGTNNRGS